MFQPSDELVMRLTVNEWNTIMAILGKQSFEVVAPLIQKLNDQTAQQHQAREIVHHMADPPRAVS
jgi:hypothetical protein